MNLFVLAAKEAAAYRDRVMETKRQRENGPSEYASTVVVTPTVIGPDMVKRVSCGVANFPRCEADREGETLLVFAVDDGTLMRTYLKGEWADCTVYGSDGHILYGWRGSLV